MKSLATLLALFCASAFGQEMLGHVGGRAALMNLYATSQPDGAAHVTGDYVLLPTLQQRFLDGDRSKQLGVTVLKEGSSPIFFGRPPLGTLQGTWVEGVFKGARYAPNGQERERFEFTETFPSMDGYSANLRCEVNEGRYASTLAYVIEAGRMKSLEWRSRVAPADHPCNVTGLRQQPFNNGLRFAAGRCSVIVRDLGEYVRVSADGCAEMCGSQGYLEPVLVDRRGGCQLLRPQPK